MSELEHTGVAASWCPLCGQCTCPRDSRGQPLVDVVEPATLDRMWPRVRVRVAARCPLHGTSSEHCA